MVGLLVMRATPKGSVAEVVPVQILKERLEGVN
jgi:hypothetical protein